MSWYPPEIEPLNAVLAGALNDNGVLLEANSGFLRLLVALRPPLAVGEIVTRFFIQPNFATLAGSSSDTDGETFRGILTVGDVRGRSQSLRATVRRADGQVRLLAEYDAEELERLYDSVLELNREYARSQLELAQTNFRLKQREAEIVVLSLTDQLTGVGNRRRLEQAFEVEISRSERTGRPLSASMSDLDHFKGVNDVYGHEMGDKVLAGYGNLLQHITRPTDIVARFGGEEFVVLMPDTNLAGAAAIAERLRNALTTAKIEGLTEPITVSIGVAELERGEQRAGLLKRVDKALYEAKESGRNRVVLASPTG